MVSLSRTLAPAWQLVLAVLLPALLAGCEEKTAGVPAPQRGVIAQRAVVTEAVLTERYTGSIQARFQSVLSFRVAGKVLERRVDAGDQVKKGELLARLDPGDAELAMRAAESAEGAARAERDQVSHDLRRVELLGKRGFASSAELDARREGLKVAEARLNAASRQLELSRSQLTYTRLVADEEGTITAVHAEAGQVVSAGLPVIDLARTGERELVVDLPEGRVKGIAPGQQVAVTVLSLPGREYAGSVREVAARADAASRTYQVRVAMPAMGDEVKLGMTATARFNLGGGGSMRLPLTSLYHDGALPAVWVIEPASARVQLRRVTVGRFLEREVEIVGGLDGGEMVVTKGVHKLHAGEVVKPLLESPAS